jgi:5'(3')-deoxyribonucleotidase
MNAVTYRQYINIDMDGVLVDFDSHFYDVHGKWPHEVGEENFWKVFDTKRDGFFRECQPYEGHKEFMKAVYRLADIKGYGVRILTALPRRSTHPKAAEEKQDWCNMHGLSHVPMCTGPYAIDKQKWVKHPHDILIDDKLLNIEQWRAKGAVGIHHEPGDFDASLEKLHLLSSFADCPLVDRANPHVRFP